MTSNSPEMWKRRRSYRLGDTGPRVALAVGEQFVAWPTERHDRPCKACGYIVCKPACSTKAKPAAPAPAEAKGLARPGYAHTRAGEIKLPEGWRQPFYTRHALGATAKLIGTKKKTSVGGADSRIINCGVVEIGEGQWRAYRDVPMTLTTLDASGPVFTDMYAAMLYAVGADVSADKDLLWTVECHVKGCDHTWSNRPARALIAVLRDYVMPAVREAEAPTST